jgi:hypothetical protein
MGILRAQIELSRRFHILYAYMVNTAIKSEITFLNHVGIYVLSIIT